MTGTGSGLTPVSISVIVLVAVLCIMFVACACFLRHRNKMTKEQLDQRRKKYILSKILPSDPKIEFTPPPPGLWKGHYEQDSVNVQFSVNLNFTVDLSNGHIFEMHGKGFDPTLDDETEFYIEGYAGLCESGWVYIWTKTYTDLQSLNNPSKSLPAEYFGKSGNFGEISIENNENAAPLETDTILKPSPNTSSSDTHLVNLRRRSSDGSDSSSLEEHPIVATPSAQKRENASPVVPGTPPSIHGTWAFGKGGSLMWGNGPWPGKFSLDFF